MHWHIVQSIKLRWVTVPGYLSKMRLRWVSNASCLQRPNFHTASGEPWPVTTGKAWQASWETHPIQIRSKATEFAWKTCVEFAWKTLLCIASCLGFISNGCRDYTHAERRTVKCWWCVDMCWQCDTILHPHASSKHQFSDLSGIYHFVFVQGRSKLLHCLGHRTRRQPVTALFQHLHSDSALMKSWCVIKGAKSWLIWKSPPYSILCIKGSTVTNIKHINYLNIFVYI